MNEQPDYQSEDQGYWLKENLNQKITFDDDRVRVVYLRLGLELLSVGYTPLNAASFLGEAYDAARADYP